ncbi:MAG: exodeoxyribonuclease V subunit beta [Verrucomicrobiota bacterium]|jgi:exodeoxyribonuclease V beta subunit
MKPVPVFQLAETELRAGASLVEASAGTGKTFTIAGLFLRLILEKNLSVREILVVTYTVAATEELRHRIRHTLARALQAFNTGASDDPFLRALVARQADQRADFAARLDRALYGFDEAPIYTIHGFCQRVLRDRAFETGNLFDTELVTDQTPLLRQLVEDYWRKQFYRAGKIPVIFALKNGLSPDGLLPLVRTSLPHPFLKLLSPVDGQTPESLAAALEAAFASLREIWREQKDAIRSHFGSGAKWANKPYNDDEAMADAFRQLDRCLGAPEFPPAALDALQLFKKSAIAQKVSKKAKGPAPAHRFFDLCDDLSRAEEYYIIGVKLGALHYVRQELPRRKDELKVQFFDDLLTRLHSALAGADGPALAALLRRQYVAALIDEFQDTDPLQYEIFSRVFTGPENYLFLIGDPKQAIYGFRGADIFTYLRASRHSQQTYTLKENWRSEASLVRSVNAVFSASARPFVFPGIQFHSVDAKGEADKKPLTVDGQAQPPFQIWFWRRTGAEINKGAADKLLPSVVATEIVELLNGQTALGDRKLLPEDIAMLVPENRQAQLVQDALNRRNVPSVLYTSASLFDSREVVETLRVLAAIADPTHESQLMAALGTDMVGLTGSQIEALAKREGERPREPHLYSGSQAEAVAKQETDWQQILERFRGYLDLWLQRGFIQMFRSFMQRQQVRPRLLAFPDGERRLTNLLHLLEVLHRASVEHRLGVSGLLKWLGEQRELEGQVAEEHQLRLETDEKAVKLVTIHKSKGLEYSVVFCPFSWKGATIEHGGEEQVFFHEQGDGNLVRDLGSPDYDAHKQQARVERLAENVRLFYVALTRAKHRCYFVWGAFRDAATSAPAWLLHPPPNPEPDPVTALENHFPQLDDHQLLDDLRKLADQSSGPDGQPTIAARDLPQPADTAFTAPSSAGLALDYRRFTRAIARDWRISSFTSLTANQGEELPDHDALGADARAELPASGIFAFPRGVKPGTCLHKIFEKLDFTQWNQPAAAALVREQLHAHGLPEAEFTHILVEMLGKVMTAPLDPGIPTLTLAKITAAQRLHELEFYFPLQRISPEMLRPLLQEAYPGRTTGVRPSSGAATSTNGGGSEFSSEPSGFSFAPGQGMLKGFIDLVFEFDGRYYLVDWKSNWLGNRVEDYGPAALAGEIRRRYYYFQCQLYTAALDRYLRLRLPGYRYDRHFGGACYLFLRGIDPARPGFGIYRDRLEEPFVRKLNNLLTGTAATEGQAHD